MSEPKTVHTRGSRNEKSNFQPLGTTSTNMRRNECNFEHVIITRMFFVVFFYHLVRSKLRINLVAV